MSDRDVMLEVALDDIEDEVVAKVERLARATYAKCRTMTGPNDASMKVCYLVVPPSVISESALDQLCEQISELGGHVCWFDLVDANPQQRQVLNAYRQTRWEIRPGR